MNKTKWSITLLAVTFLIAACTTTKDENGQADIGKQPTSSDETTVTRTTDSNEPIEEESTNPPSETTVEEEQKQMALDTLNGLAEDAKEGKVYHPDQGFIIGKTKRGDVHETIGQPEEEGNGYEHYHGSMGNPSIAFKYNAKGVLEEARYFGTNVERQTNLGGITEKDLTEQLGKSADTRKIEATGEKNVRYHIGDFELQFIIGKDGTPDHVNLKKWE